VLAYAIAPIHICRPPDSKSEYRKVHGVIYVYQSTIEKPFRYITKVVLALDYDLKLYTDSKYAGPALKSIEVNVFGIT